jgi:hypothetical protein
MEMVGHLQIQMLLHPLQFQQRQIHQIFVLINGFYNNLIFRAKNEKNIYERVSPSFF